MLRIAALCAFWLLCVGKWAFASGDIVALGSLRLAPPDGWEVIQSASSDTTQFVTLQNGSDSISLFAFPGSATLSSYVSSDSKTLEAQASTRHGAIDWKRMQTSKTPAKGTTTYVNRFLMEFRGTSYVGFSRSSSSAKAKTNASAILDTAELVMHTSLTDSSYAGKKYYLGWGAAMSVDPSNMHNEVKYDVLHTIDIFGQELGGSYQVDKLIGYKDATENNIIDAWNRVGKSITSDDMYVQYSSGHGSETGLEVGVNYSEIRDKVLAFPAKEIVIFIMACHSGGLVDSFNKVKSKWQDWKQSGRSLLVMASSTVSQNSSSGPSTDGMEGSAFGHALWKALTGSSDGYVDGVKDGFVSIAEIREYSRFRTKEIGGHTPVDTGTYYPDVIMNRVPSVTQLAKYTGGTEGLTDTQIQQRIQELEAE